MKISHSFLTIMLFFIAISVYAQSPGNKPYEVAKKVDRNGKTLYIVRINRKIGVVDTSDKVVVPVEFNDVMDTPFGLLTMCENRQGLYSYSGKLLFECKYEGFFNHYKNQSLIDVKDSTSRSVYLIKSDTKWHKLFSFDYKKYRLNELEHPYFNAIKEGEVLFCLYNIAQDKIEKIYMLNTAQAWQDVTSNKKLSTAVDKYFNGDEMAAPMQE